MCKFDQYLHTSRKSGINVYAICVGWVNFVHNLRCLLKNLRSQQNFYATAGPTGPDKYHLWVWAPKGAWLPRVPGFQGCWVPVGAGLLKGATEGAGLPGFLGS